jgi:hypothetical protein
MFGNYSCKTINQILDIRGMWVECLSGSNSLANITKLWVHNINIIIIIFKLNPQPLPSSYLVRFKIQNMLHKQSYFFWKTILIYNLEQNLHTIN